VGDSKFYFWKQTHTHTQTHTQTVVGILCGWRGFCVGGGDSVWVAGKIFFVMDTHTHTHTDTHTHRHTHRHTYRQTIKATERHWPQGGPGVKATERHWPQGGLDSLWVAGILCG
jgi:hypothetical protein